LPIDINPDKEQMARALGATDFVNPKDYDKPIQEVIVEHDRRRRRLLVRGVGNVKLMRAALECCHKGGASRPSSVSPARVRRSARGRSSW
jgi:S-(hydroxymethyl)glutathione dehydrogenase / alcohol dehydrogenase